MELVVCQDIYTQATQFVCLARVQHGEPHIESWTEPCVISRHGKEEGQEAAGEERAKGGAASSQGGCQQRSERQDASDRSSEIR